MSQQDMINWFINRKNKPITYKELRAQYPTTTVEKLLNKLADVFENIGGYGGIVTYRIKPEIYEKIVESRRGGK